MTEQETQSEERSKHHRGMAKAVKIPFVAWGGALVIHLLLLFFVSNIFWGGRKGLGTEGREYEVGIAIGAGTHAVTTEAGAMSAAQIHDAPTVDQMAFESEMTADVELEFVSSEFDAASLAENASLLESVAVGGQTSVGQGLWSETQLAGGGQGSGGASFFGLEAKGGKFVYVVDRSGSMSGAPLSAAKNELLRSIMGLEDGMEFYVFFYNTEPMGMPGGQLVRAGKSTVHEAMTWIDTVRSGGGTDPLTTMQRALKLKPDAIWLLSDGRFPQASAEEIARLNARQGAVIHTIAYFSRGGEAVLKRIAAENDGHYRFIQRPKSSK